MSYWNGWWLSIGCSLNAFHSRMWNWVRLPIRNPVFPQTPRLPLDKEKLRIPTKLRKNERRTKEIISFLCRVTITSPFRWQSSCKTSDARVERRKTREIQKEKRVFLLFPSAKYIRHLWWQSSCMRHKTLNDEKMGNLVKGWRVEWMTFV